MRTHGTLKKWNDDRGFGFIAPAEGKAEIFVHISEFPKSGGRPRIGEVVSFETDNGADGKLRAVRVLRPGQNARSRNTSRPTKSSGIRGAVLALGVIVAIGTYAYRYFQQNTSVTHSDPPAASVPARDLSSRFQCDGRTMCSQMTSCAEARYFLKHCPNTRMDGNQDGEPCEQQWCN